jgi:hypothetical protein
VTDFVPGCVHLTEWKPLGRHNRFGWVEAIRVIQPNGAHHYLIFAGRTGQPGSSRAKLRGCDCQSPSCPHPVKLGMTGSAGGVGGYGSNAAARRRASVCKCVAYPAVSGSVAGKPWSRSAYGVCNGYAGWRPCDIEAYAAVVLATFTGPAKLGPVRGTKLSTTIKYSPGYMPVYALNNGAEIVTD